MQEFENQTSRGSETELAEVREPNANYNNTNYTDLSYNNQSNQSESKVEETIDVMDDVNAYIEIIKENIEYEHYMKYSTQDKGLYDELFEVICEVVCVKHKTVKIGGDDYPYELVKSKFLKLNSSHLEYVMECMKNTTTKIMLPDEENSKATTCVDKAFEIWEETKEQKSAQLIFCDLSTPKGDGTFNVYEDIRGKLIEKGVPPEEIAFIHDANTEKRKAELFAKVRSGQVRFLLGSTAKMGAGTNVQDRLIALHHLDVPWRPSDIEQQEGRILRQGNMNDKVKIFRYVTEGTFDSYSWQLIENKQKFIGQIMTSKSPVRSCEDIDEAALSYAEVKALATGNPYIKEKMDLDIQVSKLKLLKANHTSQRYRLEDNIAKHYPMQITALKERLEGYRTDIQTYAAHKPVDKDAFSMKIGNRTYTDKKEAGAALIDMCRSAKQPNMAVTIGEFQGFKMSVSFDSFFSKFTISLKGSLSHEVEIGADPLGNLQRLSNALEGMTGKMADVEQKLSNVEHQLETAKVEVTKPFAQEQELAEKLERLAELNALLNMDEKGDNALDMGDDEPEEETGEQSTQAQEGEPDRAEDIQAVAEEPIKPVASFLMSERIAEHDKERMLADGSKGRVSVKEKLAEMKQKISDQKIPEKPEVTKSKGKEESL